MGIRTNFYLDVMASQAEVTGTSNHCVVKYPNGNTTQFVVDCGLFQEQSYSIYNDELLFNADNIDFVVVTHNHVDHTGRLPFLISKGYNNPIYATTETCELLPYALLDSYSILKSVSKRNNKKCLYSEENVRQSIKLLQPCKYLTKIKVDENINITFIQNGHLPGAAMILFQISYPGYNDINLLFTGDYNNKNTFFDVPPLPKWIRDLDLNIIQESTYGNMNSDEIKKTYKENVIKTIEKGGTVINPVFSLGRTQEILYELKVMQDTNKLSPDIPIYLDGKLAIKYTDLYLNGTLGIKDEMKNFLPLNLTYVNKETRPDLLLDRNKKIILTTSGMGSYGPAQLYIPEFLSVEGSLIQFTGYTADGTLGSRLRNTPVGEHILIAGRIVIKRALVEYSNQHSAHAKANEMINFLKQFNHLKLVLITHGETNVENAFATKVIREVNPRDVGILNRDFLFRIDSYGLVKTMSTKFK